MRRVFVLLALFMSLRLSGQEWVARYNGPGTSEDIATAIAVDGSGNVYVTGHSKDRHFDYVTIKYNSSGDTVWVRRYNGPGNGDDKATAIAVDGSGNVYVTGCSIGSGTNYDYVTIKYNSSGVEQWVRGYNGPPGNGSDVACVLAVDGSGNIYVTGCSVGSGTNYDYATIKYSYAGVEENPKLQITDCRLQICPNPFIGSTELEYGLPKDTHLTIAIYNLSGQKIVTLVNENKKASHYIARWDGRDGSGKEVVSGVYFCRLEAGNYTATKKVCLLGK